MPKKKTEYKSLTKELITKRNPLRKGFEGSKKVFSRLLMGSTKTKPFDKKSD